MKKVLFFLAAIFLSLISYSQLTYVSLGTGNLQDTANYKKFLVDSDGKSEIKYSWYDHYLKLLDPKLGEVFFNEMITKKEIMLAGKKYQCRKAIGKNTAGKIYTGFFVYKGHTLVTAFIKEGSDKSLEIILPEN